MACFDALLADRVDAGAAAGIEIASQAWVCKLLHSNGMPSHSARTAGWALAVAPARLIRPSRMKPLAAAP
ncbi:hypothetical protein ADK82_20275 [Streptomyces sp. NRRL S-4]|nr:hypothetical protein ADK82_20275 [Streptomyces sp. NRRL S-4]